MALVHYFNLPLLVDVYHGLASNFLCFAQFLTTFLLVRKHLATNSPPWALSVAPTPDCIRPFGLRQEYRQAAFTINVTALTNKQLVTQPLVHNFTTCVTNASFIRATGSADQDRQYEYCVTDSDCGDAIVVGSSCSGKTTYGVINDGRCFEKSNLYAGDGDKALIVYYWQGLLLDFGHQILAC